MKRFGLRSFAVLLLAALHTAALAAGTPRNIILFIGDGMGLAQVTAARISLGHPNASLAMDSMRYAALVKTHSADVEGSSGVITDSAAAATAMATGHKTKNGMLGVLPDGRSVRSILEAARSQGRSTGLVTTVTITHATPAGFAAKVASRGDEAEIAVQLLERRVDVLLGGGEAFFLPQSAAGSKRKDDRNLLDEARAAGYRVVRTREELAGATDGRILGLFHPSYLQGSAAEPSLAEMTQAALRVLSRNRKGFFLMVEGGQIDGACHANDAPAAVKQTLEFDAAVAVGLEFARKHGDTLVIVTADHETGGLSLIGPPAGSSARVGWSWGTKGHSAVMVPLLADGPGAERFTGVLDNTDIARRMAGLWRTKLD